MSARKSQYHLATPSRGCLSVILKSSILSFSVLCNVKEATVAVSAGGTPTGSVAAGAAAAVIVAAAAVYLACRCRRRD